MNEALTGAYERHVDVDEIPLTSRIAHARELELRGSLNRPVDIGSPDAQSRATAQPGDDPDLHVLSQSLEQRACLFIHPQKSFSMAWGFLTIVAVMWVVLSLPFKLAFLSESVNTGDPFFVVSILVDVFFCTDVVLNFYTGYYDANDTLVIDGRRIQLNYFHGWFACDVIGALPFDYFVYGATGVYVMGVQATHLIRFVKLLRLFRFLRISNLYRFLGRYEEHIDLNTIKVVKLVFALCFWIHIDSCIFFLVARWHQLATGEWAPDSWVVLNHIEYSSPTTQYYYSVWHAVSHMLSVTYGPYNPSRPEEVAMTIVSMLCGACFYASVIGTAANIIQSLDPSGTEFHRQWDELKVFMRHHNVPPALRDRLRTYFHARWHGRKIFNEHVRAAEAIIKALPEPYARAMLLHECQWLLRTVPLLVSAPPGFVHSIVPLLSPRTIMGGEIVLEALEPPMHWWLLSRGRAGVFVDGVRVMTLSDGAYFGDASLLWGVKSQYSVVTDSPCSLYVLHRRDFEEVLGQYPDIVAAMKKEAYKQTRRMGRGIAERLRSAADHAQHASAFTRIPWDWAAAEAELALEATGPGSPVESEDGVPIFAGGKFAGGPGSGVRPGSGVWRSRTSAAGEEGRRAGSYFRGPVDGLWDHDGEDDVPDDVAIAWEKLRRGFDRAGGRIRAELGQVAHRMHLERIGGGGGAAAPHLEGADNAAANTARPHLDPAAFARGFRAFGDSVETAFRDPGAALAVARERAQRLGAGVREGVRRLAAVTAHHGVPGPNALARRQRYQRSDLDGDEGGDEGVASQEGVGVSHTLGPSSTAPLPATIRPHQIPAAVRQPVAHVDVPTQGGAVVGTDAQFGEREVVGEGDMYRVVRGSTRTDEGAVSTDLALSSVDENAGVGIELPMAPQQQLNDFE